MNALEVIGLDLEGHELLKLPVLRQHTRASVDAQLSMCIFTPEKAHLVIQKVARATRKHHLLAIVLGHGGVALVHC